MKHLNIKEEMIDLIENYYANEQPAGENGPAYRKPSEAQIAALKNLAIPEKGQPLDSLIQKLTEDVFPYRVVGEHPRNFAFIPAPVADISKLGDVMTTLYNPNAAGWFSAPQVAQLERSLISFFCQKIGYNGESGGVFLSGGSLANLSAAVAARDDKLPMEKIQLGVAYVSDQAHHSVNKGLRIVGIPDNRIRKVATDKNLKMMPASLEKLMKHDRENGLIPFMVIATAGTTNAGVIDPLTALGHLCQEYKVWFHVDGALGASVLLSPTYSQRLNGIELADSVTWDAHKWLFQSYTCAMILVKNQTSLLTSFSDNPAYLKDAHQGLQVDSWDLSPELSRPALAVKLWLSLQFLGTSVIASHIDHGIQMAETVQRELEKWQHWQIVTPAQQGIITFRYANQQKTASELNSINSTLSSQILASGFANILTTEINHEKVLRMCTISPETTKKDITATIQQLNAYLDELAC